MPKELIISANAHEKKVAIIEDGVVTEFYVERQNENTGVVGNIYKGRVMKVLPGMQSAFVDIGLERDAFLYVSDFLDLEDETFDFKDEGAEKAERAAEKSERPERADRPERSERPERSDRPERGDRRAESPREDAPEPKRREADEGADDDEAEVFAAAVEETAPPAVEETAEGEDEDEEDAAEGEGGERRKRRRRRRRRGGGGETVAPGLDEYDLSSGNHLRPITDEEIASDQAEEAVRGEVTFDHIEEVSFSDSDVAEPETEDADEIEDEDEAAAEAARAAAEAEAERAYQLADFSLERIADDDVPEREAPARKSPIPELVVVESTTSYDEPYVESAPAFELISIRDEEEAAAAATPVEAPKGRSRKAPAAKAAPVEAEAAPEAPKKGRSRKAAAAPAEEAEAVPEAPKKGRSRKAAAAPAEEAEVVPEAKGRSRKSRAKKAGDADASVEEPGRSEMSTRRGGRGRRRPGSGEGGGREGGDRESGPREGGREGAREGGREGGREGAPREGGREGGRESRGREGGPRESGPREGGPREGGPREGGRAPRAAEGENGDAGENGGDERGGRRSSGGGGNGGSGGGAGRGRRGPEPLISELLHEGQEIIVQIAKEPIAKKGARITSHLVLPGRFLVYMPTVNRVGVSRKVGSETERARLKKIVGGLREREGGPGGFIARTAAIGQTEEDLLDDMRYLQRTWADIKTQSERRKAPALMHRDLDLIQRILRDQISDDFTAIRCDNELEYARIVDFVNRVQPKLVRRVKLHTRDESILEAYGVQAEIDKAVKPRVWLKSGGYIVINQTEALVSVDVNTGKFVGKSDRLEDTITRTNMEAVKEVVRQVRLRDLGGIIVIDFIDMEERRNRMKVATALEQELKADRSPSKVLGFNDFGLIIITRKRVKQSLERTLCTPCPYCQGAGLVKSTETMAFEILSEARRLSKQYKDEADDITLRVSPGVGQALRSTEASIFEEIEAHFKAPVRVKVDHELHQEQFDFAII